MLEMLLLASMFLAIFVCLNLAGRSIEVYFFLCLSLIFRRFLDVKSKSEISAIFAPYSLTSDPAFLRGFLGRARD